MKEYFKIRNDLLLIVTCWLNLPVIHHASKSEKEISNIPATSSPVGNVWPKQMWGAAFPVQPVFGADRFTRRQSGDNKVPADENPRMKIKEEHEVESIWSNYKSNNKKKIMYSSVYIFLNLYLFWTWIKNKNSENHQLRRSIN